MNIKNIINYNFNDIVVKMLEAGILFLGDVFLLQVVRAASPVLLRVIVLGAFFIYCTVSSILYRRFHEILF